MTAGNSPNSNTGSVLVCIQQTPASVHGEAAQAVRLETRCQDEQSVSPCGLLVRTQHRALTLPSAHLNPHDDQEQSSLLLKVNRRLSTPLTANQLQVSKRSNEGAVIFQKIYLNRFSSLGLTFFCPPTFSSLLRLHFVFQLPPSKPASGSLAPEASC